MPKQTKIIIIAGLVVVGIGVALLIAQPRDNTNNETDMNHSQGQVAEDQLEISEKLHDFGNVSMKNGLVSTIFKVKNTRPEPVNLHRLYTSCMCTKAALKVNGRSEGPFGMLGHGFIPNFDQTLQPNEEAEVEVVFDPNAHGPAGVGTIQRDVSLESPNGVVALMQIKATVTP